MVLNEQLQAVLPSCVMCSDRFGFVLRVLVKPGTVDTEYLKVRTDLFVQLIIFDCC